MHLLIGCLSAYLRGKKWHARRTYRSLNFHYLLYVNRNVVAFQFLLTSYPLSEGPITMIGRVAGTTSYGGKDISLDELIDPYDTIETN